MAVPRPVLIAILGLALCVTALVAVRGVGQSEEEFAPPAPIPAAPESARKAEPAEKPKPEGAAKKPAQAAAPEQQAVKPEPKKLSPAEVAKLEDDATVGAVAKALGRDDVVVLFFSRAGAADDTGARRAVRSLRGMKGVQIFSPRFEDLESYRPILAGVGVSQVPSIVITKPGRQALLVEGFVDRRSLRQQVEDALR